ncbi:MAG TPA: STAS domain-containing protein [Acidimicrobiales bacterium]|jgi:anti-sigma B factor antagonist|nr:STAS domain-containing protein [Acidimicrobiales bacterium]
MVSTHNGPDFSVVCQPTGALEWAEAVALRQAIGKVLRPGITLDIDLDQVEFVDSAGISTLVALVRRVRAAGGTAHIRNAGPPIRRRLEILGVYHLLTDEARPAGRTMSNGNDAA